MLPGRGNWVPLFDEAGVPLYPEGRRFPGVFPMGMARSFQPRSPLVCETAERASGLHFPRLAPDILGWAHRLLKSITVSDAAQTNISRRTASLHHGAMLICVGVLF